MAIKLGERRELPGSFEEGNEKFTRVEHVHYSIFTEYSVFVAMIVLIILSVVSILTTMTCCKEIGRMRETWENTVIKISESKKPVNHAIKEYCILVPTNSPGQKQRYFLGYKQGDGEIKWMTRPIGTVVECNDFLKQWEDVIDE